MTAGLTPMNRDTGSGSFQAVPLKRESLQGRRVVEWCPKLALPVKLGLIFSAALLMSEAIHQISYFGLPVAIGGSFAVASMILYIRANANERDELEMSSHSPVIEDLQKIESNLDGLVSLKGKLKMIEGVHLGASLGINVSRRDWVPIHYIADQIFLKSKENVPDDQLAEIFPKDPMVAGLFKKSRYFLALAMAAKYYVDDNLLFGDLFVNLCDGKAVGMSQKTINLLEQKFLESTDYWFPMEMRGSDPEEAVDLLKSETADPQFLEPKYWSCKGRAPCWVSGQRPDASLSI